MDTLVTVLLTVFGCACMAALLAAPVVLILLVLRSTTATRGGWQHLVAIYGSGNPPRGHVLKWQTVQVGAVNYNHAATVGVAEEGLYLAIWRSTVLIPWQAFTGMERAPMRLPKAQRLTIGEPPDATLVVSSKVFELMRPQLPQRVVDST